MKNLLLCSLLALCSFGVIAQSDLPELYPSPEKVKVKLDFPKEGRTAKNGGGYCANLALLPNGIKKIALASFYAFDPGLTKTWKSSSTNTGYYVTTTTTTTHIKKRNIGGLAPEMAYGALLTAAEPLVNEFKSLGMELLMPFEFLDTDEKKEFYNKFTVVHDKGFANWLQKFTAQDHDMVYGAPEDFIVADITKEPYSNYEKRGLISIQKTNVPDQQIYFFDKDSRMSETLGYDLCTKLGVDAVLVTYFTVFTPSETKIQLQNVRFCLFGPNPVMPEGESKYGPFPHTKGLFYFGASVSPEALIYKANKKDPESLNYNFKGFDNIYTALVREFGEFYKDRRNN